MKKDFEEQIEFAKDLARNGSTQEKENFVAWICTAIGFLSAQFNKESMQACTEAKQIYLAYLRELDLINHS